MPTLSTRDELISATKELLWERGFESTSPAAILERSGAGQGSLYYHFRGKAELAAAAIVEIADEVSLAGKKILERENRDPLENVIAYLTMPRQAAKGCRLGRFANEAAVVTNPELIEPIRDYFSTIRDLVAHALERAQKAGTFSRKVSPPDIALSLIATVQGGYVLARVFSDSSYMDRATEAAVEMLKGYCIVPKRKTK